METYNLQVETSNIGGYFSSEQLDLLTIIQCNKQEEVVAFIKECRQLRKVFTEEELQKFLNMDLEQLKQDVFKAYQNTLVLHDSNKETILNNTLSRLGLTEEEISDIKKAYSGGRTPETLKYIGDYIKARHQNNYEEIIKQAHCFISTERDQNKSKNLYYELTLINNNLGMFNTLLVGSGKPEIIINNLLSDDSENRFDYYFAKRDLDFAFRNNKHIRFHSLLTKNACEQLFTGMEKKDILQVLAAYVKRIVDFVNEYNESHKLQDGTPVINAIDLFNELVSFDKNENGEYENIWESKYGITIDDICSVFSYAKDHKPEGVNYLYNEPFLEDDKRRAKVKETLEKIDAKSPGLIDTLGSQMHITIGEDPNKIKRCFEDFKSLQERTGKHIQITEFDMSIGKTQMPRVISLNGSNPEFSIGDVYEVKQQSIDLISTIINESGVILDGISYWSLTDGIDCNLERIRSNYLSNGIITDINQIPTACGGLFPTHKELKKEQEYQQFETTNSNNFESSHRHI